MKPNHKQIGKFFFEKAKYRPYLPSFYDRASCVNSILLSQP